MGSPWKMSVEGCLCQGWVANHVVSPRERRRLLVGVRCWGCFGEVRLQVSANQRAVGMWVDEKSKMPEEAFEVLAGMPAAVKMLVVAETPVERKLVWVLRQSEGLVLVN